MTSPCGRCQLELPIGASHADERACILALRAALATAVECQKCQKEIKSHFCPSCAVKMFATGALGGIASAGGAAVKQRIQEALQNGSFDFLGIPGEAPPKKGKTFEP